MKLGSNLNIDSLNMKVEALDTQTILQHIGVSIGLVVILYLTYKFSNAPVNYNKRLNITLVMISVITTILMSIIQESVAMSLGMMGALSIVRFRTNIKDSREIGFIYWSLTIGIMAATGLYLVGVIVSLLMSAYLLLSARTLTGSDSKLLIVRGSKSDFTKFEEIFSYYNTTHRVKAKNIFVDSYEYVYEIRTKRSVEDHILSEIQGLSGVDGVNILAPNSEVI